MYFCFPKINDMEKRELLYDGKAKQIFATDDPKYVIMNYKDDASAYYGVKKSSIKDKGMMNCHISEIIFNYLQKCGIKTHLVKCIDDNNMLCRRVKAIPLEFIVRNLIAGSLARRLDIQEGTMPQSPIYEICLKSDLLRDPMINRFHVKALGYATDETLDAILKMLKQVNEALQKLFRQVDIDVVDFKLEFGFDNDGELILIDEISPDTARFWDSNSKEILDSDRFRRDLGQVEEAYHEVLDRLQKLTSNLD